MSRSRRKIRRKMKRRRESRRRSRGEDGVERVVGERGGVEEVEK